MTAEPGDPSHRTAGPSARGLVLRAYRADDAEATRRVFERAIRTTALAHYTPAETAAWLGAPGELSAWGRERSAARTVVAELEGAVVGFTDLSPEGYVDRLFVDPDAGRRGVGGALLARVVAQAAAEGIPTLTTHASLVARSVFARAGFRVVHEETVHRDGQALRRFLMAREPASHRGAE